jgi:PhoH-like ATPase
VKRPEVTLRKTFILDTNVFLFDPQAINKFGNNDIVIPIVVIEEIDRFKRDMSENGRHARQFSRFMDEMRAQGELARGVDLPGGTKVRVELGVSSGTLPMDLSMEKADNRMLAFAAWIRGFFYQQAFHAVEQLATFLHEDFSGFA